MEREMFLGMELEMFPNSRHLLNRFWELLPGFLLNFIYVAKKLFDGFWAAKSRDYLSTQKFTRMKKIVDNFLDLLIFFSNQS